MNRSSELKRAGRLRRKKPVNPVSAKRRAEAPARAVVREQVFARDGHRCRLAGIAGTGPCMGPLTPHHLEKAAQQGPYSVENMLTACAAHNDGFCETPEAHPLGLVVRRGETLEQAWARLYLAGIVDYGPDGGPPLREGADGEQDAG